MTTRRNFSAGLIAGALAPAWVGRATAQTRTAARNVVLVHGSHADGSCWTPVIARLQAAGIKATAVQNPLTSLADDVAATRRVLALQDGPTVLVAHSWGGMVISEAGDSATVSALVFVAARAPDAGEDYTALAARFKTPPVTAGLVKSDGYVRLSEEAFRRDYAGDLGAQQAGLLYAVQTPAAATLLSGKTTTAAWRTKPAWYAVSTEDRAMDPDLERFLAKRMKATTIELKSSHVSLLSHPQEIADLILAAATG